VPRRTLAGFVAALCAIVIAVTAWFLVVADRDRKAAHVTERSERILSLQRLEDGLVRAESAQRGYLLTREDHLLGAYRGAVADVRAELDGVEARAAAGRSDVPSEALAALVEAKLAELRRGVEVRDADGLAPALRELRSGAGPWLTEAIEAVRAEMEAAERAELGADRRAWFHRIALSDAIFLSANVLLLALVAAAGLGARAEMRRREEQARERLRILELQERILGIVSHDLRTPLSAIQGGAKLLARSGLPPEQARVAALVHSSSRRMERIICDLLDYTRTRASAGIPLSLRATDAGEICARVAEEAGLSDGGARVELQRSGDLLGLWDADRLEQALGNLVANAVRHARRGTPVRVRASGEGERVRIDVANEGAHIPAEALPSVFDPFRGADRTPAGLGLGLFIVRTIVEAHGGTVEVESAPDRPVTFTVVLPRNRPEPGRGAPAPTLWRPTRGDPPGAGSAAG
jgi:signal transduction histidine kinase